ncbi:DUF916 domain-containing protein [Actinoplanes sp. TRM 88003]|uniref:DUF916 domain-containing protein n=1 Tax=Paractinoplanes aksuensis TaxID=2939490 RepID=A0ABT1E3V7_9ACTN|nr:DUF916 domain-containing protein [Actinoplanes aksuensis]MCO8277793.1 DUF916 domain-containing protein [Actinoplanes aksuensis]
MRTAAATALAAVLVLPTPTSARAAPADDSLTWSVAPSGPKGPNGRPALDYKLDPGATVTDHVAVTNHSQRPLTLRLYANDAFTTPGGGFDLRAGGAEPTDAGSWITLSRTRLTLPKSSRVVVPFTLSVPDDATPGDHAAGVVASVVAGTDDSNGNQVSVDHRVGTRVYLRVTGPLRPALSITDVRLRTDTSWNPLRLPQITADFTISNTGNARLSGALSAEASGPFGWGRKVGTATAAPEILPGGSVRTSIRLSDVPPLFREQLTLSVHPNGADGRTESHHSLWLLPWPQLALLALAAVLVSAGIASRRRRRQRMQAALAAAEQRGREQATEPVKEGSS